MRVPMTRDHQPAFGQKRKQHLLLLVRPHHPHGAFEHRLSRHFSLLVGAQSFDHSVLYPLSPLFLVRLCELGPFLLAEESRVQLFSTGLHAKQHHFAHQHILHLGQPFSFKKLPLA